MSGIRRSLPPAGRRRLAVLDYPLATLSDPRLLGKAAWYVLARWRRRLESGRRMARRVPADPPRLPIPPDLILDDLARSFHLLVLDKHPGLTAIGVAEVDLLSVLAHLESVLPGLSLSIAGEPLTMGEAHSRRRALGARQITASVANPGTGPLTLLIEPYYRRESGRWVSANDENAVARAVYSDIFEAPGLTEVSEVIGGRTLEQIAAARPVDIVYTWVNHADPRWRQLYEAARATAGDEGRSASVDADNLARYHNKDELRYSLRSVAQNLPWARRIHVFTNCARPAWLKDDDPRIAWVRHDEVMPAEYLPVFNSHVIESYLHRIPDLTEHFVYLNDDFLVMTPLGKSHFFDANGTSRIQFEPYGMVAGPVRPGDPDYLNAARNSARLIKARFGHAPTRLHRHVPYALRRSMLAEIETEFADRFAEFRRNKFRSSNDLNLTSFLYHHYALAAREATLADCTSVFVKAQDIRWRAHLAEATAGMSQIVCINEGGDMRPSAIWTAGVTDFMKSAFPCPAPWEHERTRRAAREIV